MRRILTSIARMDRAILIRHFAICLATSAAFLWPRASRMDNRVVWLLSFLVLLNFTAGFLSRWAGAAPFIRSISPALAIAGWSALGCVTGGVRSPFIGGLWLEILLSAMVSSCAGTLLVTLGSIGALSTQWLVAGPGSSLGVLLLQGGFLLAMGGVTALLVCNWQEARKELTRHEAELSRRLAFLEEDLATAQRVGSIGANAARLAHGIKNVVHAMRGYAGLMQERADVQGLRRALEGMSGCIDRLEMASRDALGSPSSDRHALSPANPSEACEAIENVIREVALSYPGIRWRRLLEEPPAGLATPGPVVQEALLNLVRNAAEAMEGRGEVTILTRAREGTFEIAVRDQGDGLGELELQRLFAPGITTKAEGSGFGLFVTRRILESYGGFLTASSTRGEGSLFAMGLPLRRS